ncbi:MAG: UvrD-helicase domain-containing protein [Anaerolineae bacterium]|nr:UvrD-helicase domain-containing protein [Anaerolineae bacterium]
MVGADILSGLNEAQRRAVTSQARQVLVLAGPGSGKTRVLTYRIAYLIALQGVRPYQILAVTFTNKAAREMQTRVERLLQMERLPSEIWLGTFHATCARMLRREVKYLPLDQNFVIMDADDQLAIVRRAIKDLNISDKLYRPTTVHAAISHAKNNLLLPKEYPVRSYRDEVILRIYERYQQVLQDSNAVDFDDLLLWAYRLLLENPQVCENYQRRFAHILVDEFQDTNMAQYALLRLLNGRENSLFVVGDEDQSIYRWRGADYRNVLRFEEDYPAREKVLLEQNYRSTQTVLDAARRVIDRNPHRTAKHLSSARGESGERIILYEAVDDYAEAAYVVDTIERLLAAHRAKGSDFAVMYRTNAQSRLLEEAFLRAGLGYRLVGALRFYGRREVKDVIAFLRLAQNPADEISLARVINVPPRGIGDKTLVALQLAARQAGLAAGEVLLDLGRRGGESPFWKAFSGRSVIPLADFGALLAGWHESAAALPLPTLFDRILVDTVYHEYIDDESDEGKDRWENVQELRKMAYDFQERGLSAFLENLALVSDQDTMDRNPEQEVPTLLTLHAAKGLEFKQVFIIGLDEGLLPHNRSMDDPEEMAEERRLFYVGITRAKDNLYLVRASQRSSYGSFEPTEPSRFLEDIPENLLQPQGVLRSVLRRRSPSFFGGTQAYPSVSRREQAAPQAAPVIVRRFQPSMRVRHPSWGEGIVLESKVVDGEETVDVAFASVGFKRLIASLAGLEVL